MLYRRCQIYGRILLSRVEKEVSFCRAMEVKSVAKPIKLHIGNLTLLFELNEKTISEWTFRDL